MKVSCLMGAATTALIVMSSVPGNLVPSGSDPNLLNDSNSGIRDKSCRLPNSSSRLCCRSDAAITVFGDTIFKTTTFDASNILDNEKELVDALPSRPVVGGSGNSIKDSSKRRFDPTLFSSVASAEQIDISLIEEQKPTGVRNPESPTPSSIRVTAFCDDNSGTDPCEPNKNAAAKTNKPDANGKTNGDSEHGKNGKAHFCALGLAKTFSDLMTCKGDYLDALNATITRLQLFKKRVVIDSLYNKDTVKEIERIINYDSLIYDKFVYCIEIAKSEINSSIHVNTNRGKFTKRTINQEEINFKVFSEHRRELKRSIIAVPQQKALYQISIPRILSSVISAFEWYINQKTI